MLAQQTVHIRLYHTASGLEKNNAAGNKKKKEAYSKLLTKDYPLLLHDHLPPNPNHFTSNQSLVFAPLPALLPNTVLLLLHYPRYCPSRNNNMGCGSSSTASSSTSVVPSSPSNTNETKDSNAPVRRASGTDIQAKEALLAVFDSQLLQQFGTKSGAGPE